MAAEVFCGHDHVESPSYRTLTPDIFRHRVRHDLHFDQTRQTGVVFHMMSASVSWKNRLTAVATHMKMRSHLRGAVAVLDQKLCGAVTPAERRSRRRPAAQRHALQLPSAGYGAPAKSG